MKKISFLFFLVMFVGVVYADTNGIWNRAEDMRGGIFGGDEQPISNFTFINILYLNEDTYYKDKLLENYILKDKKCLFGQYVRGFDDDGELICVTIFEINWKTSAWSGCTGDCDTFGTKNRNVWCEREDTGETILDEYCEEKETIPVDSEICLQCTYNSPGTYSFTVPAGTTSLNVDLVAGGGGGGYGTESGRQGGGGGGGSGGCYLNQALAVTPGETLTVVVGAGGARQGNGGASYIQRSSTNLIYASPGLAGRNAPISSGCLIGQGGNGGGPGGVRGTNGICAGGENGIGGRGGNSCLASGGSPGNTGGGDRYWGASAGKPGSLGSGGGGAGIRDRTWPGAWYGGTGGAGYIKIS